MKNNTLDQILNSNLASVDPGFYQFALAKASSDLFKRIICLLYTSPSPRD